MTFLVVNLFPASEIFLYCSYVASCTVIDASVDTSATASVVCRRGWRRQPRMRCWPRPLTATMSAALAVRWWHPS